jgi:4-amino-4-deoxy-L-arabinose transferase-like glycosyltransferase
LDRFGETSNASYGDLFNVPPLGFYTQALLFKIFGTAMANGIFLITLFGLGSAIIVYKLGKEMYSKSTGVFAAALFALSPWQLILTRTFLIDVQCLFLSLLYLYFGILAIRKDSVKLAAVAGGFFALAFLTKQYAVLMLIPLLLLYIYKKPKNLKQILKQLAAFSLPVAFSTLLWYQVIMGKEILYLLYHNDFKDLNTVIPTYSFLSDFLINYGLGILFVVAVVFSFMIGFVFWRRFPKNSVFFDFVCLVTLLFILGLELYLAVNLNLKAPYTSAVKYIYQSLPFFSLVAASLAGKSSWLFQQAKQSCKAKCALLFLASLIGLFLLMAPIIGNMSTARYLAMASYLIFRVQPNLDVGYSFYIANPLSAGDPLLIVQLVGFGFVLSGLLWQSRHFIVRLFKPSSLSG